MTRHDPWSFRSGPGWLAGCLLRPGLGPEGVTQQRWPAGWRALSPPKTRLGPGGLQCTVTKLTDDEDDEGEDAMDGRPSKLPKVFMAYSFSVVTAIANCDVVARE